MPAPRDPVSATERDIELACEVARLPRENYPPLDPFRRRWTNRTLQALATARAEGAAAEREHIRAWLAEQFRDATGHRMLEVRDVLLAGFAKDLPAGIREGTL